MLECDWLDLVRATIVTVAAMGRPEESILLKGCGLHFSISNWFF